MESIAKKMGLLEPSVLSKAKEIDRLIDTKKSSAFVLSASLQCVLSLNVAATMKGVNFDKDLALKLAATNKKVYSAKLFTLEKLLDLDPVASVKEMCLKLGISEIVKDAERLKKAFDEQTDAEEVNHPMYSAGAVWVVAKSRKVAIEKAKILELARTNWTKLESVVVKMKKMNDSLEPDNKKKAKSGKKHVFQEIIDNINENNSLEDTVENNTEEIEEEDYDVWRKRMIKEAQEEIKQEAKKMKLSND